MAAHRLEVDEADVELANSRASVREYPEKSVSFADIAYRSYYEPQQLPPGMSPALEATARFTSEAMIHWANATHACTCEVDVETGHVRLMRYIVSEDVGPMINPNVVEGQIAGGTVQGIGGALLENLAYDDDGNPLASTFVDYLLPTATEVPPIEYGHVEIPKSGLPRKLKLIIGSPDHTTSSRHIITITIGGNRAEGQRITNRLRCVGAGEKCDPRVGRNRVGC
jgi:carbon-monoxide dehydrogenase large subunit